MYPPPSPTPLIHPSQDGTVLQRLNHLLHRGKKIELIEQFSEKLLVKQVHSKYVVST